MWAIDATRATSVPQLTDVPCDIHRATSESSTTHMWYRRSSNYCNVRLSFCHLLCGNVSNLASGWLLPLIPWHTIKNSTSVPFLDYGIVQIHPKLSIWQVSTSDVVLWPLLEPSQNSVWGTFTCRFCDVPASSNLLPSHVWQKIKHNSSFTVTLLHVRC